jgi:heme-degrading monooxygenase HmoA
MFVLHVEMKVKPGSQQDLEQTYNGAFLPAITQQSGFRGASLLRPARSAANYRLTIAFDDGDSQQRWVATSLHDPVWAIIPVARTGRLPSTATNCPRSAANSGTSINSRRLWSLFANSTNSPYVPMTSRAARRQSRD